MARSPRTMKAERPAQEDKQQKGRPVRANGMGLGCIALKNNSAKNMGGPWHSFALTKLRHCYHALCLKVLGMTDCFVPVSNLSFLHLSFIYSWSHRYALF